MEILRTLGEIFTKKSCGKCNSVRIDNGMGGSYCTNQGQARLYEQWKAEYPNSSQPEQQSVKKCDHPADFVKK